MVSRLLVKELIPIEHVRFDQRSFETLISPRQNCANDEKDQMRLNCSGVSSRLNLLYNFFLNISNFNFVSYQDISALVFLIINSRFQSENFEMVMQLEWKTKFKVCNILELSKRSKWFEKFLESLNNVEFAKWNHTTANWGRKLGGTEIWVYEVVSWGISCLICHCEIPDIFVGWKAPGMFFKKAYSRLRSEALLSLKTTQI